MNNQGADMKGVPSQSIQPSNPYPPFVLAILVAAHIISWALLLIPFAALSWGLPISRDTFANVSATGIIAMLAEFLVVLGIDSHHVPLGCFGFFLPEIIIPLYLWGALNRHFADVAEKRAKALKERRNLCRQCDKALQLDAKFCNYCGEPTDVIEPAVCPQCATLALSDMAFCPTCGARLKDG